MRFFANKVGLLGWVAFLVLQGVRAGASESTPPNVLLIVCDDLCNRVEANGFQGVKTPCMDRFATESVNFQRAYAQYPVCGPSRSSFLSGLYPESTRILDNETKLQDTRPGVKILPQVFQDKGYWTAGVGKITHAPWKPAPEGSWHQFELFNNEINVGKEIRCRDYVKKHGEIKNDADREKFEAWFKKNKIHNQNPKSKGWVDVDDEKLKDGKNVRQIIQWLEEKPYGDKPFFMACGIHKPHVPFWAPKRYFDMYPLNEVPIMQNPLNDWDDIPEVALYNRYVAYGFKPARPNDLLAAEYVQAYHACISFADAQIGLLLQRMRELGRFEDTIIIVTSDHGYQLGEHFLWGKATLFEPSANTPLMIRAPGMPGNGATSQALVELVDLFPTLKDLCGLDVGHALQGRSLVPLLKNPEAKVKDSAYCVTSRGKGPENLGRSIYTERWRYTEWLGDPENNELYDRKNDPDEHVNLARKPEYTTAVGKMRALLHHKQNEAKGEN
ncbi:Arylsulfatase [Pontiella desulfatans]|uniref:Arylsulfatase n=1 Tax=Pontiella desulfatans TaxID=2750659 RepID=A0A6C2U2T1_PONDE|nr:sulfatase [Pontiella desulfatans]SPS73888.1 sulfatase S1_7 [Kiritimatiellales bacterium]VGO13954.1 Arylsulfatase [Pontiella desulfatans]